MIEMILILALWNVGLTIFLVKAVRHYNKLTKGITKKELKEELSQILKNVDNNSEKIKEIEKLIGDIIKNNLYNIHREIKVVLIFYWKKIGLLEQYDNLFLNHT